MSRVRLRLVAASLVPECAAALALTALLLGLPIVWWTLAGAGLGLANGTTLFVLCKTGVVSKEYEW